MMDLASTVAPICYAVVTIVSFAYFSRATGLTRKHENFLPRLADAVAAAASIGISLALIGWLDSKAWPLYDGKMLSSAVVFFNNPRPPSPHAFIVCSAGAFLVGTFLHQMGAQPGLNTQAITLSLIVLVWKLSGSNFSATVGLALFLAQSGWSDSWERPLFYLCFPWLSGHALLYALAHAFAVPRARIRIHLSRREWRRSLSNTMLASQQADSASQPSPDKTMAGLRGRLRDVFRAVDTDQSGRIGASLA